MSFRVGVKRKVALELYNVLKNVPLSCDTVTVTPSLTITPSVETKKYGPDPIEVFN